MMMLNVTAFLPQYID